MADKMDIDNSDGETPRRRTSRKAAEKSKKNMSKMLNETHKDDKPDIDMEDSDEDDWKPTEADKQAEKEEQGKEDQRGDDCKELQLYNGAGGKRGRASSSGRAKPSTKLTSPLVGTDTVIVAAGQPLKNGDFVVLKTDADRDNVPLWRYDCHGTMQRYNPLQSQAGNYLHKSANIFSGYIQSDRDKFVSVSVKYVHADATSYTIKVNKKQDANKAVNSTTAPSTATTSVSSISPANSAARAEVIKETAKFQEPFEVYIQAIISHCLDPNFLDEVIADKDVYFLDNMEKIRVLTKSKSDKAMKGSTWPARFMQAMITWPEINLKEIGSKNSKCGACDAKYTSIEVKMLGKPYNEANLKEDEKKIPAGLNGEFLICSKCRVLTDIFHRLHHHKYRLYTACGELINKRKEEEPSMESATILTELLANSSWLESQFKKMQEGWADAETYCRPT